MLSSFAQDIEESGTKSTNISLESQFSLLESTVSTANLKVRFHLNDKHVLRTNWQFSYFSETSEILEADGDGVGSIQQIISGNSISLGYERHFQVDKISPYIGSSIGYGFGKDNEYGSRTDGILFVNDFNYSSEQKTSSILFDMYSGFDLNLYKGLYIGTEVGFRLMNSKLHRGEFRTEDASSTTDATTSTSIPEKKSITFSLVNMGVLRVGWKF